MLYYPIPMKLNNATNQNIVLLNPVLIVYKDREDVHECYGKFWEGLIYMAKS